MAQLAEHPTVKHFYEMSVDRAETSIPQVLDAASLRRICLDAGADDVGFVERGRPEIADRHSLRGQAEDHSLAKRKPIPLDQIGRGVVELEATVPVPGARQLGVYLSPIRRANNLKASLS